MHTGSTKTLCTEGEDDLPLVTSLTALYGPRTGTKVRSRRYAQRVKEASRLMREGWHGRRAILRALRGRGRRQHRDSVLRTEKRSAPWSAGNLPIHLPRWRAAAQAPTRQRCRHSREKPP